MADANQARRHALRLSLPVLAGYVVLGACLAVGALLLLGPDAFLVPALAATALVLTVVQMRTGREEEAHG